MDGERTDLIAEAITEAFGERCPDYDKDCWCCRAWQQYDDLRNSLQETLAVETRNEEGRFADSARKVLGDPRVGVSGGVKVGSIG